jgi:hypothetical protein
VAAELSLGKDQITVEDDLVDTTGRLDQLDLGVGVGLVNLGRQTGGPWLVASNTAVFNRYLHTPLHRWSIRRNPAES